MTLREDVAELLEMMKSDRVLISERRTSITAEKLLENLIGEVTDILNDHKE